MRRYYRKLGARIVNRIYITFKSFFLYFIRYSKNIFIVVNFCGNDIDQFTRAVELAACDFIIILEVNHNFKFRRSSQS